MDLSGGMPHLGGGIGTVYSAREDPDGNQLALMAETEASPLHGKAG